MKWGMPHYTKNSMVCALMGAKKHVSIFFHRGKLLKDPKKRLQGTGKTVRSIKFTAADQDPRPGDQGLRQGRRRDRRGVLIPACGNISI